MMNIRIFSLDRQRFFGTAHTADEWAKLACMGFPEGVYLEGTDPEGGDISGPYPGNDCNPLILFWGDHETVHVDENENPVIAAYAHREIAGKPVIIVRLVTDPSRGYLASDEGYGGFGNAICPSSYGRPCLAWFGPGECYPDSESAIRGETERWS